MKRFDINKGIKITLAAMLGSLCGLVYFTSSHATVMQNASLPNAGSTALEKSHSNDKPVTIAKTKPDKIAPLALVPHRAMYTIKLSGTRNGSRVSDISGRMLFSWSDDCHAWNIQQKMQLRFFYSEGEVSDSVSDIVSREAKDGSSFNFHTRRYGEEKDTGEALHGYASLKHGDNGLGNGEAVYSGENEKRINLSDALFPAHHTLQLLEHARQGKRFFTVNVFDGADDRGFSEVSSFISAPIEPEVVVEKTSAGIVTKPNQLLNARAWPIRMAFFAPQSETGSPDYEMDMTLLDNGVIKTMMIDYGDYSMTADLVEAKALPAPKCAP